MTDARSDEDFVDTSDHLDPDERDIEAPEADAAEQALTADPAEQPVEIHHGLEVGEYDAVEQARVVNLDEDYR